MIKDNISNSYFEWISVLVCGKKHPKQMSYKKLLRYLHDIEFRYSIPLDANRAEDGIDLRYRFAQHTNNVDIDDVDLYLDGPCSVLEMMTALAIRCEEDYMDNPNVGDRTRQWFWEMVVNLGLGSMMDDNFDEDYVEDIIETFLDREYEPNGKGGLFIIRNCEDDLRDVEIWYQLCWYLDSIT